MRFTTYPRIRNIIVLAILILCGRFGANSSYARDLFVATVGGGGNMATISGNMFKDVIHDSIDLMEDNLLISPTARLNYAGIPDALQLDVDLPNLRVTLSSRLTGFRTTINGTSPEDLADQIDRFYRESQEALPGLLREINARSPVAFNDGNPHSSTALAATRTFDQFGMYLGRTREEREEYRPYKRWFSFDFEPDFGSIDADGYTGENVALPVSFNFFFLDRVGVVLDLTPNYIQIESADIYQGAAVVGAPVKVLRTTDSSHWYWLVTPSMHVEGAGSDNYSVGALLYGGGISSLLAYEFPKVTLSMGNQITFHEASELDLGDFKTRPDISQQILKNGLQLTVPVGRRWLVQASGTWTHFVETAAVQDYATVGGQVAYRLLGGRGADRVGRGYIFLGAYADLGNNYTSPHIRVGTGWQF